MRKAFFAFGLCAVAMPAVAQTDVPWTTLGQVELVRERDRYAPRYPEAVQKLDHKEVRLHGFIFPLQPGTMQSHFLLSATPSDCGFCMPGGPEAVVEVRAKAPVRYTPDAVYVKGRLQVMKDDPQGVFYRLVDAVPTTR